MSGAGDPDSTPRGMLAALVCLPLVLGCDSPPPPEALGELACEQLTLESPQSINNVVIVLNDTMRADFLGAYGGLAKTPNFDTFSEQGLLFEDAFTQSPWTKPSIATLFTSLYPSQHRVESDPQLRRTEDRKREGPVMEADLLADSFVTLAEVMRDRGHRTAAFMGNPQMETRFGFEQGFEVYDDSFARWGLSGSTVVDAGIDWLEGLDDAEPFFLYLHLVDSHRPYGRLPMKGIVSRTRNFNTDPLPTGPDAKALAHTIRLENGRPAATQGFLPTRSLFRAAYRQGIEDFDVQLGRVLEALQNRKGWEQTAVIVTSDHGEALYDRGYGDHGRGLYDDETAIPLAARLPGVAPSATRVRCMTGLVDIMPSLCTYLGADCPDQASGWSFISAGTPAFRTSESAEPARRYLVTEGIMDSPRHRAIMNRNYKLIYESSGPRDDRPKKTPWSLFDRAADRRERFDLTEPQYRTEASDRAYETLRGALPKAVRYIDPPERETAPVDPQLRERLTRLGYLEEPAP